MLNRTLAPDFRTLDRIHLLKATETKLSNGIPVYSIHAGTQDLVRIEFMFQAGMRNQSNPLVASGVNDMLDEGTHTRNAEQLAEELDFYGAFIETETTVDHASFVLFSLNKHLAATLPLVEDMLKNAAFPEHEFSVYSANKHQKFIVDSDKVSVIARRRFNELLFGEKHPYGVRATDADFEAIQRNWLVDFYRKFYQANTCSIVVSGKITDNLLEQLEAHFGKQDWARDAIAKTPLLPAQTHSERIHTLEKANAIQSAIRMGRVLFNKTHADWHGFQVLNTILGGYFGSRLMANIREDKGYTYGIGSGCVSMQDNGYFTIATEVGVDVTNAAITEIWIEIEKLQNDLVSDAELDLVRNYMTGVFLRSTDGAFALADRFKAIHGYPLGYDYFDRYFETIQSISPAQIRDLAQTYLRREDMIDLVAGKRG